MLQKPKLRPFLAIAPDYTHSGFVFVWDQLGLSSGPRRFSRQELRLLQMLDGHTTLAELVNGSRNGSVTPDTLESLVIRLEEALFLDGPRFREAVENPVREPRCIGCYPGQPRALRRQLEQFFVGPKGPGLPGKSKPRGKLRAALVPHIDYPRGGYTYAWGFKEVVEQTNASLFVIIGTSHYSMHRFTLTRKDFQTPLGILPTDREYIDRLVHHYGDGLFDDEWLAHLPEHSIELEVVFLQYLYEKRRPIRMVPLVVGSFFDCISRRQDPLEKADIRRMIEALKKAEEETKEPICYLISGDLAHIGPKFGDEEPLEDPILEYSRKQDEAFLNQAKIAQGLRIFEVVAQEKDERRICGFPPTFTVLEAAQPSSGKVLHYDQYVHPQGHESVSFASVGFYQ